MELSHVRIRPIPQRTTRQNKTLRRPVAADYLSVFNDISELLEESGNVIVRTVQMGESKIRYALDTANCTVMECIKFYENIASLLAEDTASLEKEANANRRTLNHEFSFMTTAPINS